MSPPSEDLWPENITRVSITAPVIILKEQAENLATRTKGVLVGKVSTEASGEAFVLHFLLTVPSLAYTYELFTVYHNVKIYPLRIAFQNALSTCDDEPIFKNALKAILSSQHTRQVVESLLAQALPKSS